MSMGKDQGRCGTMHDPYDLDRFVAAQASIYPAALAELDAGAKRSHWMWFIFPQLAALGRSPTAQIYGLQGLADARAYLAHPVLGARLLACTDAVNRVQGRTAHQIFGSPDDLKFRSCMTLFARAAAQPAPFETALARYYGGAEDPQTLALLAG